MKTSLPRSLGSSASVWALEGRLVPAPRGLLAGTPYALLIVLAALLAAVRVFGGGLPPGAWPLAVVTTGHAALLGTALGWAAADAGWDARAAQAVTVALLVAAAVATLVDSRGAFVYVANGGWLVWLAGRGRLAALGVQPVTVTKALAGVAVGALLGGHLWLTASRTLAYGARDDGVVPYLAAVAYDVGANVPSGEGFFRGALFGRLQRRMSFAAAAALASAASLFRYLTDPRLPGTLEVVAGALLYVVLLSLAGAWLLRWSGSLVPGLGASLAFFAAYRLLVMP